MRRKATTLKTTRTLEANKVKNNQQSIYDEADEYPQGEDDDPEAAYEEAVADEAEEPSVLNLHAAPRLLPQPKRHPFDLGHPIVQNVASMTMGLRTLIEKVRNTFFWSCVSPICSRYYPHAAETKRVKIH